MSSELNVAEQAVSGLSLSDHYSVGVTLAREKLNIKNSHLTIKYIRFDHARSDKMLHSLSKDLNESFCAITVDERVNHFTNIMQSNIKKYLPQITKRVRSSANLPINLSPQYLSDILKCKKTIHNYQLRIVLKDEYNLELPKVKLEVFKRSFSYNGVVAWNELPIDVKLSETLSVFKQRCKAYIFSLT